MNLPEPRFAGRKHRQLGSREIQVEHLHGRQHPIIARIKLAKERGVLVDACEGEARPE